MGGGYKSLESRSASARNHEARNAIEESMRVPPLIPVCSATNPAKYRERRGWLMGFVRPAAAGDVAILLILFLLQLCAASAWMWRTIDTSWGFTLREDNSTCVYRNSIHALSASDRDRVDKRERVPCALGGERGIGEIRGR